MVLLDRVKSEVAALKKVRLKRATLEEKSKVLKQSLAELNRLQFEEVQDCRAKIAGVKAELGEIKDELSQSSAVIAAKESELKAALVAVADEQAKQKEAAILEFEARRETLREEILEKIFEVAVLLEQTGQPMMTVSTVDNQRNNTLMNIVGMVELATPRITGGQIQLAGTKDFEAIFNRVFSRRDPELNLLAKIAPLKKEVEFLRGPAVEKAFAEIGA